MQRCIRVLGYSHASMQYRIARCKRLTKRCTNLQSATPTLERLYVPSLLIQFERLSVLKRHHCPLSRRSLWFDRIADEPHTGQRTLSLARVQGRGAPNSRWMGVWGETPMHLNVMSGEGKRNATLSPWRR